MAVERNRIDVVRRLLEAGARPVFTRANGSPELAVFYAIEKLERYPILELLFERDPEHVPHARSRLGMPALHVAARLRNTPAVRLLTSRDQGLFATRFGPNGLQGITPFMQMFNTRHREGLTDGVELLDYFIASVPEETLLADRTDEEMQTALQCLVAKPFGPLLEYALTQTCLRQQVNTLDGFGGSPLHCVYESDMRTFELLLRAGARIIPTANGFTPIFTLHPVTDEVVRLLLNAGDNINQRNHLGQTPLMLVLDTSWIPILLANGADPHAVDNDGNSVVMVDPAHLFANRSAGVFHMIRDHRVDLSRVNNLGQNILHLLSPQFILHYRYACGSIQARYFTIVMICVRAGADPCLRDNNGRKPRDFVAAHVTPSLVGDIHAIWDIIERGETPPRSEYFINVSLDEFCRNAV